jgi:hypothetical protein
MVAYRDPQFPDGYVFKAERLEGITETERVLKPKDWDNRRNGQYRPAIGFSRDIPRAQLATSGHRTLQHTINDQRNGGRYSDPMGYRGRNAPRIEQQSGNQSQGYNGYYASQSTYGHPPSQLSGGYPVAPQPWELPPPPIPPVNHGTAMHISFSDLASGIIPAPPSAPAPGGHSYGQQNSYGNYKPAQSTYYNSSYQQQPQQQHHYRQQPYPPQGGQYAGGSGNRPPRQSQQHYNRGGGNANRNHNGQYQNEQRRRNH